jgi:hypothetical protein
MNMTNQNAFLQFHALGYKRFCPIVPPDAKIYERSTLNRQIGKNKDPRGKTPGLKSRNGEWYGFDFVQYESDETDLHRWHAMGAGVGLKTGDGLVLIDADTTNEEWARIIRDEIATIIPLTSVRVGQYPKAGYVVRTDPDFKYTMFGFGGRDEKNLFTERVEILSEGKQFVAHGIHQKTRKPYEWPKGIPAYDDLPFVSGDDLRALLQRLAQKLPAAGPLSSEGAVGDVNQESLKGKLEDVRKAVRATPNTSENFPTREDYRNYGYAIKAALQDHAHEAFELFEEWCEGWVGPNGEVNEEDTIASDWRRMKPPFRVGASKLYELAEKHSGGQFSIAEVWFPDLPDEEENPFTQIELNASKEQTDTYKLLTIEDIANRPPPKWLIERHIPEKSVGFLYSEPGIGKSFLALDVGLSIAYGLPEWHGDAIHVEPSASVVYIAAEGSYGFRNRIAAWRKARGFADNLSKRFYMIEQTINFMSDEDIKRLLRTLAAVNAAGSRPALIVVDTVSRALPGADENLQKDMTRFVAACDAVRDSYGCAVIGVHHAGKSGDMRGSTVLRGAGDFVFHLSRKKGATIGTLDCEKQKDGPDGWNDSYRFETIGLADGESSLVIERAEASIGPSTELTPDVSAAVLAAMQAACEAGEAWSRAPQSKERYAIRRMVTDFGFDGAKAEETLALWEASGLISFEIVDSKRKIRGFKVGAVPGQPVRNEGIFD